MVDQVNQEEEYHFQDLGDPEQSESSESTYEVPPEESVDTSAQMKKKIMMAAGGAILLIVIYNLAVGSFGKKEEKSDTIKPKQLTTTAPQPISKPKRQPVVQQPLVRPEPMPKPEPAPERVVKPSAETMQQLDRMNAALQSIEYSLRDLDSRLIDLQANQDKMQRDLTTKKQRVKSKTSKKKKTRKMPAIGNSYKVLGVIHGRAWLKTPKGSTLTVKPGDNLPGYGSIKLIEPEQGVVIMSTGDVIKFDEDL